MQCIQVVQMVRHHEDAVAAAKDHVVSHPVGRTESRRPMEVIVEVHRVRTLTSRGPQHRPAGIEVEAERADFTFGVPLDLIEVVSQSQVQGQARVHLPVVLQVEAGAPLANVRNRKPFGTLGRPGIAHHEGGGCIAGDVAREDQSSVGLIDGAGIARHVAKIETRFQPVTAANPGDVVHQLIGLAEIEVPIVAEATESLDVDRRKSGLETRLRTARRPTYVPVADPEIFEW